MLQEKVFKRFRDSDMYLASAIDANSTDVSSIYEELEHLKAASDVIAVYGTFSAFSAQSGDLGYLSDKDIIKVLKDETVSANQTYYQYNTSTSSWNFICSLEPYYSITETDAISSYLNDRINTKVDQTAFDSYSAIVSADLSAIHTDLDKKLYTSAFNSYSESVNTQLQTLSSTKLDKSTFNSYSAHVSSDLFNISGDLSNIHTDLDKKLYTSAFNSYSANVNTQLQTLSSTKLDKSTFSAYQNTVTQQFNTVNTELDKKLYTSATSNWDVTPYSGSDNVSVQNHVISLSGKSELVGDNKNIAVIEQGSNTVVSAMKDFVDLITVNSAITSAVSSKLDTSTFNTYKNTTNTQISALSANKLDVSVFTNSATHFKHTQTASAFVAASNNQAIVALTQTENGNVSAKFGTVAPNVEMQLKSDTHYIEEYMSISADINAATNTKTFTVDFEPSATYTRWLYKYGIASQAYSGFSWPLEIFKNMSQNNNMTYLRPTELAYPASPMPAELKQFFTRPLLPDPIYDEVLTSAGTGTPDGIPKYADGGIHWYNANIYVHAEDVSGSPVSIIFRKVDVLPEQLEDGIYYLI